jgi:hypothetical protein
MKKRFIITLAVFVFFGYALFLAQFRFVVVKSDLQPENPPGYFDYKGGTHTHTARSTGSGNPEEVIAAAQELGFDFLFLTEVNKSPIPVAYDGYYSSTLVLSGGEYSYLGSRIMFYNNPVTSPPSAAGQRQVYFADLLSQKNRTEGKGITVMAHPLHSRYKWDGQYPIGLDGIEIVNLKRILDQAWQSSKTSALWSLVVYPFNSSLALLRLYESSEEEIELWDQLNRKRKTVAFMGHDATARAIINRYLYLKFPSYTTSFSIASNHVLLKSELTGEVSVDREKISKALRFGQFYIAFDILADPKGFYAEIQQDDRSFPMGSELELRKDTKMIIQLPANIEVPFEVVFYRDGQKILTSNSARTLITINEKGVYRATINVIPSFPLPGGKRWLPWIITNCFYVK